MKNLLFLLMILLLVPQFIKTSGVLCAAVFLLAGLVMSLLLMQLLPGKADFLKSLKKISWPVKICSMVFIVMTGLTVMLVRSEYRHLKTSPALPDTTGNFPVTLWIFLLMATLFSIQIFLLLKDKGE
ncbi:MAG: hypothetical protein ACP5FZ_06645 [Fidelibacterota bacterium]